jgi:peptidyl-prolyl cis-trans isomerase C
MGRSRKNSSKNTFFTVAALVTVSVAALYFVFNGEIPGTGSGKPAKFIKKEGDVVVAKVNGKPIYSSEAEQQFTNMIQGAKGASFSQLDEQARKVVIRELAAQKMILEDAYKQGIPQKTNVQQRVNSFKENVIKEEFLAQMAKDQVTEEKIRQRYESDVESLKGKNQYRVKHILVETEAAAKSAQNLVKKKSFEQVAKDKSIDEKTALTGGDLGFLIEGNMVPEIENAIKDLKVGGVSEPVKTNFGWHLIKVESKEAAEPAPYDQVKNMLARALYQEAIQNYVSKAVEKANIEILASANADKEPEAKAEKAKEPASAKEEGSEDSAPESEMGATEDNS